MESRQKLSTSQKNSLLNIKILLEKTDPFHMPIVEILLKTQ